MLTNSRIKLREILETDIPQIAKLCNDETIHQWVLNIPYPYTEEDAKYFYTEKYLKFKQDKSVESYAIQLNDHHELIGLISLHINKEKPYIGMIGYWIGAEYRNKGYMTEATNEIIRIGFQEYKLKRIYATHKVGNEASVKVMLKAGMEYEGTLRANLYYKGEYHDSPTYSIINSLI
jgi:[ribosomal protein S5]-alanine N-acetyltransferase